MTTENLNLTIDRLYLSQEEIAAKVKELGQQITKDFKGEELVVVCILKGAFMFASDLCRGIDLLQKLDFMAVSSYGNSFKSSGKVSIDKDITENIEGKNVLIVEDIIDSGLTLSHILNILNQRNPKCIKVCVLCNKPSNLQTNVKIDYCGFEIENDFIVGYGLDRRGYLRNLPYIGTVKK
jgi:hypoxanthine phosphoribosyltransferase